MVEATKKQQITNNKIDLKKLKEPFYKTSE